MPMISYRDHLYRQAADPARDEEFRQQAVRAYDKLTGNVVHEVQLPGGPTIGFPITYLSGGRQYIVVAALDGENIAELVALTIQ